MIGKDMMMIKKLLVLACLVLIMVSCSDLDMFGDDFYTEAEVSYSDQREI
jgi:hypothetical protein